MTTEPPERPPSWWRHAAPAVVGSWLVARVLTAIGYLVARSDLVSSGRRPDGLQQALLSYDGSFYWLIALRGYPECRSWDFSCVEGRRFFPLFPALGRLLSELSPWAPSVTLVIVANAASLAAGFAVWRLMRAVPVADPERFASISVWLLAVFPASSVLPLAYAESLAILATAVALHAALVRSGRWQVRGGVAGFAGGLIRPTGIFVSVAAAAEAWRDRPRSVGRWALVVVAPVFAVGSFHLLLGALVGDVTAPLTIQRQLRGGFREPVSRLVIAIWRTLTQDFRDGYNVVFALAAIALVALAATRFRSSVPWSWTVMAAAGLWVALAANNIDSLGRYLLSVFPAWLAALALLTRERRWVLPVVATLSVGGYVWMTVTTMRILVVP